MGDNRSDLSIWYWLLGAAGVIAFICLFLFDEPIPDKQYNDCDVKGKVVDQSENPILNFEITITTSPKPKSVRIMNVTDDSGLFAFSIQPGEYTLQCTATGFKDYKEPLTITSPSTELTIIMKK